jgi:hypothetical protein
MSARPIADVGVGQVEEYLHQRNWSLDSTVGNVSTIWHRPDADDAEVVLPLSRKVRDFEARLQEALSALASYEKRAVADVVGDIVGFSANVIIVRVKGADTSTGTIPIEDGVLLIKKAKELLYAASMSAYAKRRHFRGAPPKEARTYMDSLLLGQTEVGSYVVNVIAPLDSTVVSIDGKESKAQLSEIVAHSLIGGLEALAEAAESFSGTSDLIVFERAVARGASANMCDALLGFSGKNRDRDFEVKVSSPSGPMFGRDARVFAFDATHVDALEKASGFYKNDYVLPDREIVGFVKHLHRAKGDEAGKITVEAQVGDTERSVQIQLGPEDYHQSVVAHDKKALVQCRGDVHVKNRTTRLLNPTFFRIVELPSLF